MKAISLIFLATTFVMAAPEPVESIMAVVDGNVILRSEYLEAVAQAGGESQSQAVLQSLIDDKVLLARAARDSLIATPDEIRMRVESHLQMLMARQNLDYPTLEKAIRQQMGMNMSQFREHLGKQISQQVIMNKMRQRYIGPVEPTRQEVEKFYASYKDSLPPQMNSILISHIQIPIAPSQARVDSVKSLAQSLIDSLDRGIAWELLTQRHSQDSAAAKGGVLGYFRKGVLEPEYERAAWRLNLGQYTDKPVQTRLGWHIIKILGKRDDQLQTAQILLRTKAAAQDSALARSKVDSIRTLATSGNSFAELAKKFSSDKETAWKGGSLGWMERAEVDSSYARAISTLEVGEVGTPIIIDGSWHLFRLDQSEPKARRLTLADDYPRIQEFAITYMTNQKLQKLVERWRKEVLIEVREKR